MRKVGIGSETKKTMEQEMEILKAENNALKIENEVLKAETEAKQKK